MRPKITCHMITSIDGRLLTARWTDPADGTIDDLIGRHYDATAERLEADGWIAGRKTMAPYVEASDAAAVSGDPRSRAPHVGDWSGADSGRAVAVVIDPSGRLRYGGSEVEGDHVVAVLSERVSDDHLARLRADGTSYVFAGPDGDRIDAALDTLGEVFGVGHLLLEGGGITNGAFLANGLIDEVSALICPTIDGLAGVPAIFEHAGPPDSLPAAGQHLRLRSCETLDGGVVWLRHEVVRR